MNKYKDLDIGQRDKILIDSFYKPFVHLWEGYVGKEDKYIKWINDVAFKELTRYNERAKKIDLTRLQNYFSSTVSQMTEFTGFKPRGKWYIFYGPKWTNLGGFFDGTMLVDLAHPLNNGFEPIAEFFPHEITHQIYSSQVTPTDKPVVNRVIDEGFACYVSYLFHGGKTSIASELDYSNKEFNFCRRNEKEILHLFFQSMNLKDEDVAEDFADRGVRLRKNYPGAIGYYIGFRIIEEYVAIHGTDSWRDIFTMSPDFLIKESGLLSRDRE